MAIRRVTDPARVAPLFEGWPEYLLRAVLDGEMGEAYATQSGAAALLYVADFGFLAGDAQDAQAEELAQTLPHPERRDTQYWVPRDEAWAGVIRRALGERAREAQRYAIRKDVHRFDEAKLRALAGTLPAGCELRAVDGPCYRMALAEEWSRDLVANFGGEADFLARGLGVVALQGGRLVSGASSYTVYHGGIEVEIDTRADCRRQGLATACGAGLLLACFARGLYPSWDAHSMASVGLAEKLGYVYAHPYTVFEIDG